MPTISYERLRPRARNLFIIASAIIIYLLAGADIDQLAVGALKAPAQYPVVLRAAAVGALIWFWWRYLQIWFQERQVYRTKILGALHDTSIFQHYLIERLRADYPQDLEKMEIKARQGDPIAEGLVRVVTDKERRLCVKITQLDFRIADRQVRPIHPSQNLGFEITIPWWLHYSLILPISIWQGFRYEYFADLVLPHIAFIVATFLVISAMFWVDPAGVFGLLPFDGATEIAEPQASPS